MKPFLLPLRRAFVTGLLLLLGSTPAFAAFSVGITAGANVVYPGLYAPGSSVTLAVLFPGAGDTFQWFHDGVAIPGATDPTLTLTPLTTADSGNYAARRITGAVETSDDITISVIPLPASPVDPTFTAALPSPANAYTPAVLRVFPDESSLVLFYDTASTSQIVRLKPDGSLDTGFTYPAGAGAFLGALDDGTVLTNAYPFRLNADGSSRALTLPAGFNASQPLTAATGTPEGKLLIAQGNAVARLNANDSVDTTFSYASGLSSLHAVTGFKFDAAGRIFVYATERDPVPGHFPSSWPVIVRLLPDGTRDTAFDPQTPPLLRGRTEVYPLSDGRVMKYVSYEGIPTLNMLKPDGTIDFDWTADFRYLFSSGAVAFAVDPDRAQIYTIDYRGVRRVLITPTTLVGDPDYYAGNGSGNGVSVTPAHNVLVTGTFNAWDGHDSPRLVRLLTSPTASFLPPLVTLASTTSTPTRGSTATFSATVTGTGPVAYQWLGLDGQPMPAVTNTAQLVIPNVDVPNLGRYQLRVTSPVGTVLSYVLRLSFGTGSTQLPYLANLSGRAYIGTGDDVAIVGLAVKITAGARGISTLLRGVGPTLQGYGVGNFLPNPALTLFNGQTVIANNDTWGNAPELSDAAASVGAFPLTPDSNDAALTRTFLTGNTTLQLFEQSGASGVGLLEIYRLPTTYPVPGDILNLSLRARTGPGEKVTTAGFVIVDPQGFDRPARVLIRVIGPTLTQYGVAAPLPDPVLTLYHGNDVVAQNDNWTGGAVDAAAAKVGAFPLNAGSKDAAILIDLPAGVYSVQATGATGTANAGVTLIEIYLVR